MTHASSRTAFVILIATLIVTAVPGWLIQGNPLRQTVLAAGISQDRQDPVNGPVDVYRAMIEYRDGKFQLQKLIPLKMILLPPDADPVDPSGESGSGFWIELLSPAGDVLYRKIMQDPLVLRHEISPSDMSRGDLRRHESLPAQKLFSILIPAVPDGGQVVFFSSVIGNLHQPMRASQADIRQAAERGAQPIGTVKIPAIQ